MTINHNALLSAAQNFGLWVYNADEYTLGDIAQELGKVIAIAGISSLDHIPGGPQGLTVYCEAE